MCERSPTDLRRRFASPFSSIRRPKSLASPPPDPSTLSFWSGASSLWRPRESPVQRVSGLELGRSSSPRCVLLALGPCPQFARRPHLAQTDLNRLLYRFQVGSLAPAPCDSSNSAAHPLPRRQVDASAPAAAGDTLQLTTSIFPLSAWTASKRCEGGGAVESLGPVFEVRRLPVRPSLLVLPGSPSTPFEGAKLTESTSPVDSRSNEVERARPCPTRPVARPSPSSQRLSLFSSTSPPLSTKRNRLAWSSWTSSVSFVSSAGPSPESRRPLTVKFSSHRGRLCIPASGVGSYPPCLHADRV